MLCTLLKYLQLFPDFVTVPRIRKTNTRSVYTFYWYVYMLLFPRTRCLPFGLPTYKMGKIGKTSKKILKEF